MLILYCRSEGFVRWATLKVRKKLDLNFVRWATLMVRNKARFKFCKKESLRYIVGTTGRNYDSPDKSKCRHMQCSVLGSEMSR
jgi:hypothetical protein